MIILASASEWRKRLWDYVGQEVVVMPSGVSEDVAEEMEVFELVCELAIRKARHVQRLVAERQMAINPEGEVFSLDEHWWVIGADEVIYIEADILGKPNDLTDARRMLERLEGNTHQAITGVCVIDEVGELRVDYEVTDITLASMSSKEIEVYLATGEWEGKAAGYQILKSIHPYIQEISGGVSNVIGMPMQLTLLLLTELGCDLNISSEQALMKHIGYLD